MSSGMTPVAAAKATSPEPAGKEMPIGKRVWESPPVLFVYRRGEPVDQRLVEENPPCAHELCRVTERNNQAHLARPEQNAQGAGNLEAGVFRHVAAYPLIHQDQIGLLGKSGPQCSFLTLVEFEQDMLFG